MATRAPASGDQVITDAIEGRLSKHALVTLLSPEARRPFLDSCAAIELKYTEACRNQNDPCLASGCSAEGERCLEPLLCAGVDYYKACGAEWAKLFADRAKRADAWAVTLSGYDLPEPAPLG
jgi:hypothetical protein